MPPSDPRRPARGRGAARGQVAAWSVLPAAAVVIVVGGLFWASVWIVFRTPSTRAIPPSESSELIASSDPIDAEALPIDDGYADDEGYAHGDAYADDEGVADDPAADYVARGPGSADENAYAGENAYADENVYADAAAEPAVPEVAVVAQYGESQDDGGMTDAWPTVADAPVYEEDHHLVAGPIYGPAIPETWDGMAVASADSGQTDEGMVVDIAARAAELTAKAEELTARIEGLTSRMEELQNRIEVSGTILAAVPSPVPSPVPADVAQAPAPAARRQAETVTVRNSVRNVQPPVPGRAPWVVMPQPVAGSKVPVGSVTLEARARGEAPITQIVFQLDGVEVATAMDRRDDITWRGQATVRVNRGPHTVAVFVKDEKGRVGSHRWEFTAGP